MANMPTIDLDQIIFVRPLDRSAGEK